MRRPVSPAASVRESVRNTRCVCNHNPRAACRGTGVSHSPVTRYGRARNAARHSQPTGARRAVRPAANPRTLPAPVSTHCSAIPPIETGETNTRTYLKNTLAYIRRVRRSFDARHPWRAPLRGALKHVQFRSWRNCRQCPVDIGAAERVQRVLLRPGLQAPRTIFVG